MTAEESGVICSQVRGLLDAPASPPAPTQGQDQLSAAQPHAAAQHKLVSGFCKAHNVQMILNTGKTAARGTRTAYLKAASARAISGPPGAAAGSRGMTRERRAAYDRPRNESRGP